MDAPPLSSEPSRELAQLRRRAYGPDADIHRDPDALRRLLELEDLAHVAAEVPDPDVRAVSSPSARPAESALSLRDLGGGAGTPAGAPVGAVPEPTVPAGGSAGPPVAPAPRDRWRRASWVLAGAVGLAAGLTIGLLAGPESAPAPDVVLGIDSANGERKEGFANDLDYWGIDPASVVPHGSFDAVDVWTARGSLDARCLLLSQGRAIIIATCANGGLDPVYDLTVFDGFALRYDGASLPDGSVVRFVARQSAVDVWVRSSGSQREASATTSRTVSDPRDA